MTQKIPIRRLIQALYLLDDLYIQMGKTTEVSGNALVLFYALDDGEPHTQKSISQQWGIPRTTLNTIVKKYEQNGYIQLEHVPDTRREMNLVLTEKGKIFASQVLESIYSVEADALQATLTEVSSDFIAHVELFARNMERAMTRKAEKNINDKSTKELK